MKIMKNASAALLSTLCLSAQAGMPVGDFIFKTKGGSECLSAVYNSQFNQTVVSVGDAIYYCNSGLTLLDLDGNTKENSSYTCASVDDGFSAAPFGKYSQSGITISGVTVVELGQASNGSQSIDIVDAVVNVTLQKSLTYKADKKGECNSLRASARTSKESDVKELGDSKNNSHGPYDLINKLNNR